MATKLLKLNAGIPFWDFRASASPLVVRTLTLDVPDKFYKYLFRFGVGGGTISNILLDTNWGSVDPAGQAATLGSTAGTARFFGKHTYIHIYRTVVPHDETIGGTHYDSATSLMVEVLDSYNQNILDNTRYLILENERFGFLYTGVGAMDKILCVDTSSPVNRITDYFMNHSGFRELSDYVDNYVYTLDSDPSGGNSPFFIGPYGRARFMDDIMMDALYETHQSNPGTLNFTGTRWTNGHRKYRLNSNYPILPAPICNNYPILRMMENSHMAGADFSGYQTYTYDGNVRSISINHYFNKDICGSNIISIKLGNHGSNYVFPDYGPNDNDTGWWWTGDTEQNGPIAVTCQMCENSMYFWDIINPQNAADTLTFITGGPLATQFANSSKVLYCPTGLYIINQSGSYNSQEKYDFLLTPSQFGLDVGYDIYCPSNEIKIEMLEPVYKTIAPPGTNVSITGYWRRFLLHRAGVGDIGLNNLWNWN